MNRTNTHRLQHTPLRKQLEQRRQRGKREAVPQTKPQQQSRRNTTRLIISGMVLAVAVMIKLTMPDVMERYQEQVLNLLGRDTDFVEAFSAVGEAIGDGVMGEIIDDAYVAVFGPQKEDSLVRNGDRNTVIYSKENTPYASMIQHILGFDYVNPVDGHIASCFGYRTHPLAESEKFHYGLDIAADEGTIIKAFGDGVVAVIGSSTELGNYVEVNHENGYSTIYAHCSRITASDGQSVQMGDPIAEVGQTGETTGPHLHFSVCQDTLYLNPIYYVAY